MEYDELQSIYAGAEYYWGTEPNALAERALEYAPEGDSLAVVDVGAGEGRDSVLFAEAGHDVLAVDVSPNGLAKAERLADDRGVELSALQGDVNTLALDEPVDVFYSIGTMQYLRPELRERQFAHFRELTVPGGVHALFAFVDHPDVPPAPDWGDNEHFYAPGELPGYYDDWELLFSREFTFDDDSGGEPHVHAAEEYVFRNPPAE